MRKLRVRYMMKTLSKPIFSEMIYKSEREYQKNMDLHHILELISISGIESFIAMVREFPEIREYEITHYEPNVVIEIMDNVREKLKQLDGVREYCNEQLKEVSITYNCTVHIMDETFTQGAVKYTMKGKT